ncbi:MAG: endonuclease/exonuclease/phosphatase family protein [Candidatus Cryptobacteroides sp.]
MNKTILIFAAAMLVLSCTEEPAPERTQKSDLPQKEESSVIKVMSSNLRYKSGDVGDERWDARKFAWINMLSANQPDIVGLQELATEGQYEDLEVITEYDRFKIMPGDYTGEDTEVTLRGASYDGSVMLMWKKSRFDLVDKGYFWQGEKPFEPHDYPFGATDQHCRACVWVKLMHKATGCVCYAFNTHYPFDPEDKASDFDEDGNKKYNVEPRLKISKEIISFMKEIVTEDEAAIFLTGDLNCSFEDSSDRQGYRSLAPLSEYMWSARECAAYYDGKVSFNGFVDKERNPNSNIDHIFYRGAEAGDFITVTDDYGVKWVSDHYPVTCTFKL